KTLATRAHAARIEVELEPERFRVSRAAVAHHPYLAAGFLIARPRTHHERVVDRHSDDFVDALRFQLFAILHVTGHVFRRAGRCKRAGKPEDHDLLALQEIVDLELVRSDGAAVAVDFDEFGQRALRQRSEEHT